MNAIELHNVTLTIDGRTLLKEITVSFREREFVVVFGPNGAGKTTLLKLIIGQFIPTSGDVKIFGDTINEHRKEIGYVAQGVMSKRHFPLSVLDTVCMGRYGKIGLLKRPSSIDFDIAAHAIKTVGLDGYESRYLAELSGGELQRVFLAQALALQPRVLLLDEATSGVDAGAKESLYDLLARLKNDMLVIFVTHDMSVVSPNVDGIVCLNRTLVSHGKPEVALTDEALKCMYGHEVAIFSHCHVPHVHTHSHD